MAASWQGFHQANWLEELHNPVVALIPRVSVLQVNKSLNDMHADAAATPVT